MIEQAKNAIGMGTNIEEAISNELKEKAIQMLKSTSFYYRPDKFLNIFSSVSNISTFKFVKKFEPEEIGALYEKVIASIVGVVDYEESLDRSVPKNDQDSQKKIIKKIMKSTYDQLGAQGKNQEGLKIVDNTVDFISTMITNIKGDEGAYNLRSLRIGDERDLQTIATYLSDGNSAEALDIMKAARRCREVNRPINTSPLRWAAGLSAACIVGAVAFYGGPYVWDWFRSDRQLLAENPGLGQESPYFNQTDEAARLLPAQSEATVNDAATAPLEARAEIPEQTLSQKYGLESTLNNLPQPTDSTTYKDSYDWNEIRQALRSNPEVLKYFAAQEERRNQAAAGNRPIDDLAAGITRIEVTGVPAGTQTQAAEQVSVQTQSESATPQAPEPNPQLTAERDAAIETMAAALADVRENGPKTQPPEPTLTIETDNISQAPETIEGATLQSPTMLLPPPSQAAAAEPPEQVEPEEDIVVYDPNSNRFYKNNGFILDLEEGNVQIEGSTEWRSLESELAGLVESAKQGMCDYGLNFFFNVTNMQMGEHSARSQFDTYSGLRANMIQALSNIEGCGFNVNYEVTDSEGNVSTVTVNEAQIAAKNLDMLEKGLTRDLGAYVQTLEGITETNPNAKSLVYLIKADWGNFLGNN